MTRRTCPYCHARVAVLPESSRPHEPLADIVLVYDEHDPCRGSYTRVDAPPVPVEPPPEPTSSEAWPCPLTGDVTGRVWDALAHGPASAGALAVDARVTLAGCRVALRRLRKAGAVRRVDGRRWGRG